MEDEAVAGYHDRTFRTDWQGGWWTPVGVGLAVVAAGVAAWVGRREMDFEG